MGLSDAHSTGKHTEELHSACNRVPALLAAPGPASLQQPSTMICSLATQALRYDWVLSAHNSIPTDCAASSLT